MIQYTLIWRVVVNGKTSDWVKVTSGVPEGALLASLLFYLYIRVCRFLLNSKSRGRLAIKMCHWTQKHGKRAKILILKMLSCPGFALKFQKLHRGGQKKYFLIFENSTGFDSSRQKKCVKVNLPQ